MVPFTPQASDRPVSPVVTEVLQEHGQEGVLSSRRKGSGGWLAKPMLHTPLLCAGQNRAGLSLAGPIVLGADLWQRPRGCILQM